MMDTQQELQIDDYLSTLRAHLGPITLSEREEIVLELRAHIRDSVEQTGGSASTVLGDLGPARDLAQQYRDGLLLSRAGRSLSPLVLLHATFRMAAKGLSGLLVFLCGLFGYALGGGLVLTALIKPFLPAQTGLWIADGRFVGCGVELSAQQPGVHDVLGWMYIPLALITGAVILALTSVLIRAVLRVSKGFHARLRTASVAT